MKTNPPPEPMLEREFTLAAILAMLSGVTITIAAAVAVLPRRSPNLTPSPRPPRQDGDHLCQPRPYRYDHGAQLAAGGNVTLQLTEGSGHTPR